MIIGGINKCIAEFNLILPGYQKKIEVSLSPGRIIAENNSFVASYYGLGASKYESWAKFPGTGLVRPFPMGNEPGFRIPYLYNFTDAP